MTLSPGTQLGHYEIRAPLGAGGMGEVYLAQDTKLRRPVAVKLLPEDFSRSQERLRRFEQEAYAVAALNHPSIAHLYEIGESEGTRFIAMEYVEGVTLREMMHGERPDLRRLVEWLAQVADGLAKAHAAGIVHRDLKPDNVMIARDGYAKILDFGLAKLVEPPKAAGAGGGDAGEAATALTPQLSQPGVVMGTIGYMSPEQARGRGVDQRSDIFSFGCILFEAATGRKPFEGESVVESLHKTMYEAAAPVRDLNPSAPPDLQRIVRRCLAKDPEERYQSIKDVAIELKELRRELEDGAQPHRSEPRAQSGPQSSGAEAAPVLTHQSPPTATGGRAAETEASPAPRPTSSAEYIAGGIRRHKGGALFVLVALAVVLAGLGYGVYRMTAGKQALSFQAAKLQRLTNSGKVTLAAISPDGRYVVHVVDDAGQQSLWVRQVTTASNVQIVAPSKAQYRGLTFSPDGDYIYFVRRDEAAPLRTLYQSPVLGGATRKVWEDVDSPVTFSPDGKRFAFVRLNGTKGETSLLVANTDGSGERSVATRKEPSSFGFRGPAWSPDGKVIACAASHPVDEGSTELVEVAVEGGAERVISSRRWGAIDQVAWMRDGGGLLMSAADVSSNYSFQLWYVSRAGGEAQRVTNDLSNYSGVSLTADSRALLTVQREGASNLWIAPGGDANRARQITSGKSDGYTGVAGTSDNRIVHSTLDWDIWIAGGDGSNPKLLSVNEHNNRHVSVSPDNRYVVFESWRGGSSPSRLGGVWRMDLDGGNAKQLASVAGANLHPQISPDGKWVVYDSGASGKNTLWKVSIDGGEPTRLTDEFSSLPTVSPDGKMVAGVFRRDLKAFKLALVPFEGGQPTKEYDLPPLANLQENGVRQLRWSPDGRALHFIVNSGGVSNLWSQPVDGGAPRQITDFKSDLIFAFDWSRDGRQLVLSRGTVTRDAVLIANFK